MKLKKVIALVLLAVYLFAAGAPAYASLSCHCVAMKGHTAHLCCHHCDDHQGDPLSARADIDAPCCGDHHSIDIQLYTGATSSDAEKVLRSLVIDLPPMLAAVCPCPAHIPFLRETLTERPTPLLPPAGLPATGLRAPPVLA